MPRDSMNTGKHKSHFLEDHLGREFRDLRLSLTNQCNFRCIYCVDQHASGNGKRRLEISRGSNVRPIPSLAPEDYAQRVKIIHDFTGLEHVRLTGGEPTLYRSVVRLVELLKEAGIPKVSMTTNGSCLERVVRDLRLAGLDALNISLDALDHDIFEKICGCRDYKKVFAGIDAAARSGLDIKINCTIVRGTNETEIVPVFEYGTARGAIVRYLELMNMGHLYGDHSRFFFSQAEILTILKNHYNFRSLARESSSTANYWVTDDNRKFGIIANHSSPFCHDCNRLRMDWRGRVYGCLSTDEGIDFNVSDIEKNPSLGVALLRRALGQKQNIRFRGSKLSMKEIGG